jgi:glycerophosphoryl diester phosphodiesterase
MSKTLYLIALTLLLISCKSEEKSDQAFENLYFGHRGSGANVYEEKFIENTLSSVDFAMNYLDGCEVDIQMSKDGTIWLYHDDMLGHFCDTTVGNSLCIPNANDALIEDLQQCRENQKDRIYKLDEVLKLLSEQENKRKFLSLDVKGYFDSLCFPYRNAPDIYFNKMAKELVLMVERYDLADKIIVETDYTIFLDTIKKSNEKIRCHLIGYKNFPDVVSRAIDRNYDGVSFSLFDESITVQEVQKAKEKGLEVQVWPINDTTQLQKAKEMRPFSMQISKLKFSE